MVIDSSRIYFQSPFDPSPEECLAIQDIFFFLHVSIVIQNEYFVFVLRDDLIFDLFLLFILYFKLAIDFILDFLMNFVVGSNQ